MRVTSSYTYLSNDGSFWVKSEPEATSFLDGRGWSCRGTRVALEYCGDLKASVDRGLESFRTLYNIYEK